jgi:hypothetical protein
MQDKLERFFIRHVFFFRNGKLPICVHGSGPAPVVSMLSLTRVFESPYSE